MKLCPAKILANCILLLTKMYDFKSCKFTNVKAEIYCPKLCKNCKNEAVEAIQGRKGL